MDTREICAGDVQTPHLCAGRHNELFEVDFRARVQMVELFQPLYAVAAGSDDQVRSLRMHLSDVAW